MTYKNYLNKSLDERLKLAENDPIEYQSEMTEVIKDFIEGINDEDLRTKLYQLQWKIDSELRHYKDPVARMNKMILLFWEGVTRFQKTLNNTGF